jgi:hypothetical protein
MKFSDWMSGEGVITEGSSLLLKNDISTDTVIENATDVENFQSGFKGNTPCTHIVFMP